MKHKEEIKLRMEYFQNLEGKPLEFDEEAILAAYRSDSETQSLSVKILSVFGGLLACLAFLGFLFISGLYTSGIGLLILGVFHIVGSMLS